MSTAGRPTFRPAMGAEGRNQSGNKLYVPTLQTSARDIRAHTQLKVRQPGQQTQSEVKGRDLKRELEERELKYKRDKRLKSGEEEEEEEEVAKIKDVEDRRAEAPKSTNIDADDSDEDSDSDSSASEDEEDDTAELLKELDKIKKEREQEARQNELMQKIAEQADQERHIMNSNPLLSGQQQQAEVTDFTVKKRWYDDTIFKNQAKGELKIQKRFINDTVRNDFHKKFLSKYIQ